MADGALIKRLPQDVVNRIAAGEVVERPASVVKELVENSLDAGAGRVEIEVRDGGKTLIRVSDDGQGMGPDDLSLAFASHATSKLRDVDDLLHVGTLGFRGEALASIGAVSRATITSRRPGESGGHRVVNEFGAVGAVVPAAAREGTLVEVAELFRNVPARAKFLKSTGAELARITEAVYRFGISTPEAELKITHGGRTVATFPAGMERRRRIARAYGRDLLEELIEASGAAEGVVLEAFLAPPSRTYRDTSRMLFFLNGRHVRDRALLHAVRHAYDDLIFGGRQPMAFLFLTMDPGIVDQNVHPAKLEVRFRHASTMHSLVNRTVREALTGADLAHPVRVDGPAQFGGGERGERVKDAVADYLDRTRGRDREEPERPLFPGGKPGAGRPVAGGGVGRALDFLQVRDTYIVLETAEGIAVIDQHALHERVLYDRIRARYLEGGVEVQRFLRPAVIDLSPSELESMLEEKEALARLGVLVEAFGTESLAVQGLPAAVSSADPAAIVEGLLARLREDRPAEPEEGIERLLSTLACHAAVRAGDRLGRQEVADLLEQAEGLTHAHTCPHGRPTELALSYQTLERHFHRR